MPCGASKCLLETNSLEGFPLLSNALYECPGLRPRTAPVQSDALVALLVFDSLFRSVIQEVLELQRVACILCCFCFPTASDHSHCSWKTVEDLYHIFTKLHKMRYTRHSYCTVMTTRHRYSPNAYIATPRRTRPAPHGLCVAPRRKGADRPLPPSVAVRLYHVEPHGSSFT